MKADKITEVMGSRVLVRLVVGTQITPGGIVLPAMAQKIQPYGDVLAVGPENKDVAPGNRVMVFEAGGIMIEEGKSDRVVLFDADEIIAIIEDE